MSEAIFDGSALADNNSNHCPCANFVNRSKSLFFATSKWFEQHYSGRRINNFHPLVILTWLSETMPEVISCNPSRIAEEETDSGQSRFGHPDLTNFGQSIFGSGVCHGGTPRVGLKPRKRPRRVGPRRVGPQISHFFFPSPAPIFALFVSLWGSSRGFLVVFGSAGAVKCARLEFWGCRVKPRRPKPPRQ